MRLGQTAFSDQQTAFSQSQSPLNPHSAKSVAMNPRYFQPIAEPDRENYAVLRKSHCRHEGKMAGWLPQPLCW